MSYISDEKCTITCSGKGKIRVLLAFPNTYYTGMSNLGLQVLYRILNLSPDTTCERVFLPGTKEIQHLINTGKKLTSLESGQPFSSFNIIAFSLSFENDYLNILTMLSLGKIPLLQTSRSSFHPLIIAGGISVFLNPEPLADIFDQFIIGEAEEVLKEFLDTVRLKYHGKNWEKPSFSSFADIEGVYIPSANNIKYNSSGLPRKISSRKSFIKKIKCRHVADLDSFPASSCFSTPNTEFSDMLLVEASRGCPRGCRFCAAGSVYKPYRVRNKNNLLNEIQSLPAKQSKIGILGSAVSDFPDLPDLIKHITSRGRLVSISSLRADSLTEEMVSVLKESRHKTFTIAPEAGSERLRQGIGKSLTNEEIFRAAEILSKYRIPNIRLYFMIGLPGENEEDIKAIIRIAKEIKHVYYKEAKQKKWLHHITLSISPFVPKPFTPFQWHPYEQVSNLKRKIKIISNGLKKERKFMVNFDLPKWGYIQTLLSRGDRRVGKLLLKAFAHNGDWARAFRDTDINPDFYVYRERDLEETLPWDFIDHSINKKKLWEEYQKALHAV